MSQGNNEMSLLQHYITTCLQILEEREMSYGEQTKLNTVGNWKSGQENQEGKSRQLRPKWIINHFLLGQAPLQLNQLLLLPKFSKKTDTVGKKEKDTLNVYHHILDGCWTTSHIQFQPSSKFISIKEIYKQQNSDNMLPLWTRGLSVCLRHGL